MPANGTKANISDLIIHHLPGDGNGLFGSSLRVPVTTVQD
jgi:hypothetical protein